MFKISNEKKIINPERDWFLVLIFFAISFSMIVIYNVYVFKKIENGTFVISSSEAVVSQTLRKESIEEAVGVIELKRSDVEKALRGEFDIPDPSI